MKHEPAKRPRYAPSPFKLELSAFDLGVIAFAILLAIAAWWFTESATRSDAAPKTPLILAAQDKRDTPPDASASAAAPRIRDTRPTAPLQPTVPSQIATPPLDMLEAIEKARSSSQQHTAANPAPPQRNLRPEEAAQFFAAAVQAYEKPVFGLSNTPFSPSER